MATIINASNSTGLTLTSDLSGVLQLQQNGVALPALSVAPAFSAYFSGSQSIPSGTLTKIQFNTEYFDTNSNYDATTNYRFTPTVAGYYQINLSCRIDYTGQEVFVDLYKNNDEYLRGNNMNVTASFASIQPTLSTLVYMNGTTDYLEGYIYQSTGSSRSLTSGLRFNNFSGFLARGA